MSKIALLATILLLLTVRSIYSESTNSERDALMALYNSTGGATWLNNDNWGAGDPCDDSWHGVNCEDGHVTGLMLSTNQLSGSIPAELAALSNLRELSAPYNQLSGPIPAELGDLVELRALELANNQLSGPIPAELSNLIHLRLLVITGNPALSCWETEEALDWALGIETYYGTQAICRFVTLPRVVFAGG